MQHLRIRTFIVDDSTFYRGILSSLLKKLPQVDYLGSATNGTHALAKIAELKPDLVTLDVEMPGMNGIEVLQKIRQAHPEIQVVMISASTRTSASNTIEALRHGALEFITKPQEADQEANERALHRQLRRILSIVETRLILTRGGKSELAQQTARSNLRKTTTDFVRPKAGNMPEIVVIGVSTGGPQSLPAILEKLPASFCLPVLIIQHLPSLFVSVLANSLNKTSKLKVVEITDNLRLEPGKVYLAPGGTHTRIKQDSKGNNTTILTGDPPENFCRPSIDYTFRSVADAYGNRVLAIIMTGMGKDGVAGIKSLRELGATTIAQDEASSIVFGMPMEAINADAVDYVLPLEQMADAMIRSARRPF